jgi:hypothetical protein
MENRVAAPLVISAQIAHCPFSTMSSVQAPPMLPPAHPPSPGTRPTSCPKATPATLQITPEWTEGSLVVRVNSMGATSAAVSICRSQAAPETSCSDGLDNDCDGLIDGADTNCGGPPHSRHCRAAPHLHPACPTSIPMHPPLFPLLAALRTPPQLQPTRCFRLSCC